jgi:hypothetical protein
MRWRLRPRVLRRFSVERERVGVERYEALLGRERGGNGGGNDN